MNSEHIQSLTLDAQHALSELESLIQQHYPDARFAVSHGHDDPESIHLMVTVDLEDTDPVFELVLDRMMEFQIDKDLPIFVIPVRPPERVQKMRDAHVSPPVTELPVSAYQS